MSDKELIYREDAKANNEYVAPVAETDRLSPVTQHEMTAIELLYAVARMYTGDSKAYLEYCNFFIIKEDMESAMRYIEEWALRHLEKTSDGRWFYSSSDCEMTAMELLYTVRRMSSADSHAYGDYFTLFIIKEDIKSAMRYVKEWALKHPKKANNE